MEFRLLRNLWRIFKRAISNYGRHWGPGAAPGRFSFLAEGQMEKKSESAGFNSESPKDLLENYSMSLKAGNRSHKTIDW